MCPPKRQRTVCRGRSRLGDERRSKRVLAGDEELDATVQPFDVPQVWRAVGLLVRVAATVTCQHQVPDSVDWCTSRFGADHRPGEEVVDFGQVLAGPIGGDGE